MTKRLAILVLILASILNFAWSASVGFVYGNAVASVDFETLPKVGEVFKDDKNNVLIVRDSSEKVIVFDRISTRSSVEVGSPLVKSGHQKNLFIRGAWNHASLGFSMSTVLYPLKPLLLAGVAYSNSAFNLAYQGFYFTAGFETDVVLSKLWDTSFTLIEDGGVTGWCTAGVYIGNKANFVTCYGLSYRHYIGLFRWELGLSWVQSSNSVRFYSPFVGLGVSL